MTPEWAEVARGTFLARVAAVEDLGAAAPEGGGEQGGRKLLDAGVVLLHGIVE